MVALAQGQKRSGTWPDRLMRRLVVRSPGSVATSSRTPAKKGRTKDTRTASGDGAPYFDKGRGLWVGQLMVGWKPSSKDPKKRIRDIRRVTAKT